MSAAEFLAWCETRDNAHYELFCGEVVAMAPERAEHGRAKANAWRALADAIARTDAPCEAFVDSLGVRIDDQTVYEPDVLVNCGDAIPPEAMLAPSPIVIVEVISPSSRNIDKNTKLSDYFRVASVAHYLLVDLKRRLVLHYRRQGDEIVVSFARDGQIALTPPGIDISVADIFA